MLQYKNQKASFLFLWEWKKETVFLGLYFLGPAIELPSFVAKHLGNSVKKTSIFINFCGKKLTQDSWDTIEC